MPNPDWSYSTRASVLDWNSQNWTLRTFEKEAELEEGLRILANKKIPWTREREKKGTYLESKV